MRKVLTIFVVQICILFTTTVYATNTEMIDTKQNTRR